MMNIDTHAALAGSRPVICGDVRSVPNQWAAQKRAFDVVFALAVLLVSSPLLIVAMLAICLSSPGNPMCIQERVGRYGHVYRMYKLRTMIVGAERLPQPILQKQRDDKRILPIGRILRKLSLDELPNLINVLRGEMSIVGPRPLLVKEHALCIERHGRAAAEQRLQTRPGLTGLWQVSGRAQLHFDERIQLDIAYTNTWTPQSDLKIILKTIPVVCLGQGAY